MEAVCDVTSQTDQLWVKSGFLLPDITGPQTSPQASGHLHSQSVSMFATASCMNEEDARDSIQHPGPILDFSAEGKVNISLEKLHLTLVVLLLKLRASQWAL